MAGQARMQSNGDLLVLMVAGNSGGFAIGRLRSANSLPGTISR